MKNNWTTQKLGDLFEFKYGKGLTAENRVDGSVKVYGSNGVIGEHDLTLSQGPTIIVGRKGSVGEVAFSPVPCWPIDTTYYIDEFPDGFPPEYWAFYLKSLGLGSHDKSSAIPGVSRKDIYSLEVSVPSPDEQRRIFVKLKELLAKVEMSQKRLNKIPAILKHFRQSVLAAACSGRLTADWQKNNSDIVSALDYIQEINRDKFAATKDDSIPDSWCSAEISIFTKSMANGIYKPEKFYDSSGIACLRMYNIQNGKIIWENIKRMILTDDEIQKYRLEDNDILINRVNSRELVGKAAIIKDLPEAVVIFESKNIRLRLIKDAIIPEYVNYCFLTRIIRDVFEDTAKQTVGMATVSQPQIASVRLPIPPLAEQQEIVRRVEDLFKIANRIEEQYKKAKAQVDKLTQSILAKTFRGELVPQDPNDEPASKLLERIKTEKKKVKYKKVESRRIN